MSSHTTYKGDIAEQKIILDLMQRGYKIARPLSGDSIFDIIAIKESNLYRVQCKYSASNGKNLVVRCRRTGADCVTWYTSENIDWMAIYDPTTDKCYYLSSQLLGTEGRNEIRLAIIPPASYRGTTKYAADFLNPPVTKPQTVLPLLRCGCSSVVERDLPKVDVVGSTPIIRSTS
jgi:hypothetical protein